MRSDRSGSDDKTPQKLTAQFQPSLSLTPPQQIQIMVQAPSFSPTFETEIGANAGFKF